MLPLDFIDLMTDQLPTELDSFCRCMEQPAVTSVRLNPDKLSDEPSDERVPWHPDGYYLKERPNFTLDPLLHAGCYYVQDASSMFLYQVLEQYLNKDAIVLDLCAAPGGKATLISEFLHRGNGLLIANEVVRQRVFVLSENIQKWGNGNTIVTYNKPQDFGTRLPQVFDCIVVDAPCSGEGMFRKDPTAVEQWSPKLVAKCVQRQKDILSDVYEALKPGGVLVYSTCTFNRLEDEQIALWIEQELNAERLPINTDISWGITPTVGYHFYPHKTRGEGFYICAFRKKQTFSVTKPNIRLKNTKKPRQTNKIDNENEVRTWLKTPTDWAFRQADRFITAYPAAHKELIDFISEHFICISTGIGLAEIRGKTPVPQHPLALAKDFQRGLFPEVELTLEQAIAYLKCEAIALKDAPKDILLLTYRHTPLGFVKNIGEHCNNLYPKEWRIRMRNEK